VRSSGWGKKAARLPDRGTLLFATDLQGNLRDLRRLVELYEEEQAAGSEPFLLLCGDLVHGPSDELTAPGAWPTHLGTFYLDSSRELVLEYMRFAEDASTLSLLGNHEHAHIGGPVVSKFYDDEAAVLDAALGADLDRVHDFFRSFPLIAVAPCGAVFTHGAPRGTERDLDAFELLTYDGYKKYFPSEMYTVDTVGALLWSRHASVDRAQALLRATSLDGAPNAFVAYGHDVVAEGYEKVGDEQICVSTSYGLEDSRKTYLRLDLSRRYANVHDLREGQEIRLLYPRR